MKVFKVIVSNSAYHSNYNTGLASYTTSSFQLSPQPVPSPVKLQAADKDDCYEVKYFSTETAADLYLIKINAAAEVLKMTSYVFTKKVEITIE